MNFTQSIGNLNELKCISKFIQLGYECSIPYGNGAKYDFIADINGELIRIQCKTSSYPRRNGVEDTDAISFSTVSQTTNTQKTTRHLYTKDQIDFFATSFGDQVYLVPVDECSTSKTLRFKPPTGNTKYNKAEDYKIEKFFSQSKELLDSKNSFLKRIKEMPSPINESFFCKKCGKKLSEKDSKTGLCVKCYLQSIRKERPSREELKSLIRTMPFTEIGRKFNVTDNAIRKWCDAEGLPRKVSQIKKYSKQEWDKI